MGIVDGIVHSIGRDVRKDAGELLVPILLALAGGLTGTAGVGFLTAWVYLTLSIAVGQASAALLTGLGLVIVAAGLLVFARNRLTKKTAADPPVSQPAAPATGETGLASQIAVTAAFVLARSLGEGRRD